MDKELPFFKFKPGQWSMGTITTCKLNTQGLFINICSLYWSKQGVLELPKARKKFKDNKAWDELLKEEVIKVSNDHIIIEFLDEQLGERKIASSKAREAALERWSKSPKTPENADGMQPHATASSTHATQLDEHAIKRREEERREEEEKTRTEEAREEFELNESSIEMSRPVAEYFSIAEVNQYRKFALIVEFCKQLIKKNEVTVFKTQFDYYKRYKAVTEEKIHGLHNFIGEPPDYNAAWNEYDWKDKFTKHKPRKPKHTPDISNFDKND